MSGEMDTGPRKGFVGHARRTIGDVLREQAVRLGDKTFMTWVPTGERHGYRQVDEITTALALRLVASGIRKGERIALFMDNSPQMVWLLLAAAKAGAVAAPINTAAKGHLLAYYLGLCEPAAVFTEARYLDQVRAAAAGHGISRVFARTGESGAVAEGVATFEQLLASAPAASLPPVHYSDLAMLLFTSGTTGPSKAIEFTHAATVFWGGDAARCYEWEPTDIDYVCLPLFHGNAVLNSTYGALLAGAAIVLTERFSVSRFWSDIRSHGVTRFILIGAMVQFLWNRRPGPEDRDHPIRIVTFAPTPKFAQDFMRRFGVRSLTGFALTDFAQATVLPTDAPPARLGSVGRARPGITVKIFDDDDNELPPGQIGEIVLRSDNPWGTSLGYFRNSEATVQANRNQWFHTGDNGYLDADGYLYFLDRKKDAIRRRGENISAFEVEQLLGLHPAVQQAAVYAVRAELPEDEVAASVVLRPEAVVSHQDLARHCAEHMAHFMVPRFLEFVDSLPKTPSEKVEKFRLRERARQDMGRFWDREAAGMVLTGRRCPPIFC